MVGIVISRADTASLTIKEALLSAAEWRTERDESRPDEAGGGTVYYCEGAEMREFDDWHLELDRPADAFDDVSVLVFASRHSGETGPLLTAHHTGNFGLAEFGGEPNNLARACPNAHSVVLESLKQVAPDGYEVGMECTHHGPTDVGAPSMFVEIGSDEQQWNDSEAGKAVAEAILSLRGVEADNCEEDERGDAQRCRHLVGFGGGHYAQRFERIVRQTDWSVGHIAADWGLDGIDDVDTDRDVLSLAFEMSNAAYAVIDGENSDLRPRLEQHGYRVVSETWVRETAGVSLSLVDELESEIGAIADGLRLGDHASVASDSDWTVVRLPEEILAETVGTAREELLETVQAESIAFLTAEGGNIPTGTVVLSDMDRYENMVEAMVSVLDSTYDEIEREANEVTVRTESFDPDKADTLGVPEGPAFGKLAAGQSVEVHGETIPPNAVRTVEERTFSLEPDVVE